MADKDETRRATGNAGPGRSGEVDSTEIIRPGEISSDDGGSPAPVPARIGKYRIIRELGRGGMGVVYEAVDSTLDRRLAIKVLTGAGHRTGEDRERFRREAETSASLSHPNIVSIHEFGEEDGVLYYTMDFVEGESLKEVMSSGVSPVQAAEIVEQLARAVHYAHRKGVIHRDLKPGNVVMDEQGTPKIMDFGLAKFKDRGADLTGEGVVVGTPLYMSPEQAEGRSRAVDERSDIYSLGAILYEMLTGSPPFQHENEYKLLSLIAERDPVPPRKRGARIHRDLETICLKCLEKRPEKRYQTALALAEDLRSFLNGEPIRARPVSGFYRWLRRLRPYYDAIAVGMVALLVIGGVSWYYAGRLREREERSRFGWTEAYFQDFEGASVPPEWKAGGGRWWVRDGRLVGTGKGNVFAYLDREFPGDVRVEARCRSLGAEIGVSILGTKADPVDGGYFLSLRSGAGKISKRGATVVGDSGLSIPSGRDLTVVAQRQGETVKVWVEGSPETSMEFRDPLPVGGEDHNTVALYTFSGTLEVDWVKVYRVSWPEETSPLKLAEQFLRNGRYSSAFDLYAGAAANAKDPDTAVRALFGAARSVEEQGDFRNAARYYLMLRDNPEVSRRPDIREKALFRAIRCSLAAGNRKQAQDLTRLAEKEYPVSDEWRILVAYHLEEAEAARRRHKVLRRQSGSGTASSEPWRVHDARAEAMLRRIESPDIRRSLARALARTYMELGSDEDMFRAVRLDPDNALIQVRVSEIFLRKGNPREALVHAEKAAAQGGQTKEVRIALGDALMALGRFEEALVSYEEAASLDPFFMQAHRKRAVALYVLNRTNEAAEVIKSHPDDKEAFFPQGVLILADAEGPGKALEFFAPLFNPLRSGRNAEAGFENLFRGLPFLAVVSASLEGEERTKALSSFARALGRPSELPERFAERALPLLERAASGLGPGVVAALREEILEDPVMKTFLRRRGLKPSSGARVGGGAPSVKDRGPSAGGPR